jgi:hypothetical protein
MLINVANPLVYWLLYSDFALEVKVEPLFELILVLVSSGRSASHLRKECLLLNFC